MVAGGAEEEDVSAGGWGAGEREAEGDVERSVAEFDVY